MSKINRLQKFKIMITEEQHNKNIKRSEYLMDLEEFGEGMTPEQKTELEILFVKLDEYEDKIKLPWDKED